MPCHKLSQTFLEQDLLYQCNMKNAQVRPIILTVSFLLSRFVCKIRNLPFGFLSAKLIKWPNTLKQFFGSLPMNCLSVFGHFVGLALKGLTFQMRPQ